MNGAEDVWPDCRADGHPGTTRGSTGSLLKFSPLKSLRTLIYHIGNTYDRVAVRIFILEEKYALWVIDVHMIDAKAKGIA